MPISTPDLPEIRREEVFFRSLFPDLRVVKEWERRGVEEARWIHIPTHFRLDERLWPTSGFPNNEEEWNILRLLQIPLACDLLSLGACDLGNPYTSVSPYWLGFAELFLNQGVGALLVSRWSLDDLGSDIYRDFFSLAKAGLPMDEALAQAKRNFVRKHLNRDRASTSGQHPFFWAGVTYVGRPGERLYPKQNLMADMLLLGLSTCFFLLSALFLFTAGQVRRRSAWRRRSRDC